MLDLGWTEILLIAAITLIVVGPKELPNVLRTVSFWVRRARGLARDFQKGVDEIVREAELDDIKKELKDVSSGDMSARIENAVDPTGEIKESLKLDESAERKRAARPAPPSEDAQKPVGPSTPDARSVADEASEPPAQDSGDGSSGTKTRASA